MNIAIHKLSLWSVVLFGLAFGIGWAVLPGLIPPFPPTLTPEQIAAKYAERTTQMRIGMSLLWLFAVTLMPWSFAVAAQIRRIEGDQAVLAPFFGTLGAVIVLSAVMPAWGWLVIAYRPEMSPQLVHLINDFIWIMFIGWVSPTLFMAVTLAIATFVDRSPTPVFPRWFGYFNCWVATLDLGGAMVVFFKSGPFAWNGLFAFWLPLIVISVWFPTTTWLVYRNLDQMQKAQQDLA
jgi:hypothetical protein